MSGRGNSLCLRRLVRYHWNRNTCRRKRKAREWRW
jgi:hypothetical protein